MKNGILSVLCILLCSCVRDSSCLGRGTVHVDFNCFECPLGTRSSYSRDCSEVWDWQVFAVDSHGEVVSSACSGGGCGMLLSRNEEYRFYAVANIGEELPVPDCLEELLEYRYAVESVSTFNDRGLPMSYSSSGPISFTAGTATVEIPLERAVARYSLHIDRTALKLSGFELESVTVRQSACDVSLFTGSSRAVSVGDCDFASGADLEKLKSGEPVSFYILENCQGVLLPDNRDQWKKVPENIPGHSSVCTYLEIGGRWKTLGAESDIVCRLYLGRDNCTDFNVDRNTDNHVELYLTDGGLLESCWKVFRTDMDDRRVLRFPMAECGIVPLMPEVPVALECDPPGQQYSVLALESELEASLVRYRLSGDTLYLGSTYSGEDQPQVRLSLRTWDGITTGSMLVKVIPAAYRVEGIPATIVEAIGVTTWPSLRFSPEFDRDKLTVSVSDKSVLSCIIDKDDSEQPIGLKAVGPGFAWVDIKYGTYTGRTYVYVPPACVLTGLPSPYLALTAGASVQCRAFSYPDNAVASTLRVKSSDPSVASVTNASGIFAHDFVYGGVNFGDVCRGESFTVNGLKDGKAEISLIMPFPSYSVGMKTYVIGPGHKLAVRADVSDGRGTIGAEGNSELRIGTENGHAMAISFAADATITCVELNSLQKNGWHPDRDTDEYYSVYYGGKRYRVGECCKDLDLLTSDERWTVTGQDCNLYFNVTVGSDNLVVPVRIRCARDYSAGDD